ncbi:MAG: iron ABC transporter permease, partial [Clostridiales bacterium]|nr:iron ABC transporter permease [Clostridiales bacterium]
LINANIAMKTWQDVRLLSVYVIIGLLFAVIISGRCNLLALEDKTVRSLGVNVTALRLVVSVVAVLLASITTAVAGAVSFVGLIVPHMGRILVGSEHRLLIPFSALLGAFTLLLADTVGRLIAYPYEISPAVIMSVVGGPFFIILLKRSDKTYGN